MPDFDDEFLKEREEEEERRRQFVQQQQLERMMREELAREEEEQRQNSIQSQIRDQLTAEAKQRGKSLARKLGKKAIKTAAYQKFIKGWLWRGLLFIFANPITWIVLLAILCFAVLISYCDSIFVKTGSKIASITSPAPDFCEIFEGITNTSQTVNQYGAGSTALCSTKLTDPEAWAQLQQANIGRNKPHPQTSFEGINQSTISEAIGLKASCNCDLVVTGGTESGYHAEGGEYSHVNGFKFDLRLNDILNNYVKTNFTPSGTRGGDGASLWTSPSGAVYALEGDHWDVLVKCK